MKVFPLENGIIVKLKDDSNFERFDPFKIDQDTGAKYVSILDHPHDSPTSLGIFNSSGPSLLEEPAFDILFVSNIFPLAVSRIGTKINIQIMRYIPHSSLNLIDTLKETQEPRLYFETIGQKEIREDIAKIDLISGIGSEITLVIALKNDSILLLDLEF